MTDPSQGQSTDDEDVSVTIEGSLDAEDGSLSLDYLTGDGFNPDEAAQSQT